MCQQVNLNSIPKSVIKQIVAKVPLLLFSRLYETNKALSEICETVKDQIILYFAELVVEDNNIPRIYWELSCCLSYVKSDYPVIKEKLLEYKKVHFHEVSIKKTKSDESKKIICNPIRQAIKIANKLNATCNSLYVTAKIINLNDFEKLLDIMNPKSVILKSGTTIPISLIYHIPEQVWIGENVDSDLGDKEFLQLQAKRISILGFTQITPTGINAYIQQIVDNERSPKELWLAVKEDFPRYAVESNLYLNQMDNDLYSSTTVRAYEKKEIKSTFVFWNSKDVLDHYLLRFWTSKFPHRQNQLIIEIIHEKDAVYTLRSSNDDDKYPVDECYRNYHKCDNDYY